MIIRDLSNFPIAARDTIKLEVGESKYEITELKHGGIAIKTIGVIVMNPVAPNKIIIQEIKDGK